MSGPTGHHDRCGIPIHVGDLLRVDHYTHRRNRRTMNLFFRVAKNGYGQYVVQNWNDLDASHWQCLLRDCGLPWSDVVSESETLRGENGEVMTFNERKRKART